MLSCKTGEQTLSSEPVLQTEIIDVLLLNSPLYGTGSLCVLMRRPWMVGKAKRNREKEREERRGGLVVVVALSRKMRD